MSTPQAGGAVPPSRIHPGIVVGAIAVVVFGAAGTASLLGWLPSSQPVSTPVGTAQPGQQAGIVPDAVVLPPPTVREQAPPPAVAQVPAPVAPQPAARPAPKPAAVPVAANPVSAPAPIAAESRAAPPAPSYEDRTAQPVAMSPPVPPPAPKICANCGTVSSITPIEKPGEGSGAGAVVGGILGGVLGHQVGSGRGKDVATVAGALGGALLGNQVEKNTNRNVTWEVRVRLEDGTNKVLRLDAEPSFRVGDKVRIENDRLVRG